MPDRITKPMSARPTNYKTAGVDIDAGEYARRANSVPPVARTMRPEAIGGLGGFGGLFRLATERYAEPILVAGADGVGTKIRLAIDHDAHDAIGIDLVAMCANDVIVQGAEPLFFLDYVAMSHDDPPLLEKIVEGITEGCLQSDCALIGGETAIMPDLYAEGDYDLAGFCVGVVERKHVIDGSAIAPDDLLIGIASAGLHSNGFSLARKIVFEIAGLKVEDRVEALDRTVLLEALADDWAAGGPVREVLAGHEDDSGPSALGMRLLGSIHRLVLTGRAPDLARYFPTAGGTFDATEAPAALLRLPRRRYRWRP